jgi:hypothetical protein
MFEAEQTKAFEELQRRLRQFYDGEIRAFTLEQRKSIQGEEAAAYAEANRKIRPIFEKWGHERAPVLSRLTLLAGFPDPGPNPGESEPTKSKFKARKETEIKQLRLDLKRIDADFTAARKALLDTLLAKSASDQAALQVRISEFAASLDKRAEQEANAQIRQAATHLTFKLASPTPIHLPEIPPQKLTIPAERPLESPPRVPSRTSSEIKAQSRSFLEQELRIWLGVNRYTLARTKGGHRDATAEFQQWRDHHVLGP